MTAMERSEPSLAPQWLRSGSAGSNGSGNAGHLNTPLGLSSRAEHGVGTASRNSSMLSESVRNIIHSTYSVDINTPSNFRRSTSSNGYVGWQRSSPVRTRPYASFGRSNRDRHREKDYNRHKKDKPCENGHDDIFDNFVAGRDEKGILLRSQSMIAQRQSELFIKKVGTDPVGTFPSGGGGGSGSGIHKASFDREFPSLGYDERPRSNEGQRVSSPGPTVASASMLIANSTIVGGVDGWTSVLADAPVVGAGNGASPRSVDPTCTESTVSSTLAAINGLNMAETLAQAPLRARAAPELSVETQRLEELAIKMSRQLIPLTPTSKTVALNSSDKQKIKGVRNGDAHSMSQPINTTIRGMARSEASKGCQVGNFQILHRDKNSFPVNSKESSSANGSSFNVVGASAAGDMPSKLSDAKHGPEMISRLHSTVQSGPLDKKLLPRSQDRSDFFNSLRKKANTNITNTCQGKDGLVSSLEKSDEQIATAASTDCQVENSSGHPAHSDASPHSQNGSCDDYEWSEASSTDKFEDDYIDFSPTEEEFKFLKELGWKEDEIVEHITEEEIETFRRKHMNKLPSSACRPLVLQK